MTGSLELEKGLSFPAIARCPNGCGEELRLGDKADHCKNDCPKRQAGELALWHWWQTWQQAKVVVERNPKKVTSKVIVIGCIGWQDSIKVSQWFANSFFFGVIP